MSPIRSISRPAHVSIAAVASLLLLNLLGGAPDVLAQQGRSKTVSATATLTILKGSVQRVPAGNNQAQPVTDGMNLEVGDRVLTGPNAEALVTFLDGSTLTVMPNGDVTVKKAEVGIQRSTMAVQINLGKVWARVARLADPKSSFSLESNTATATVHDGLIGGQQETDGTFTCWTKAGPLTVTDGQGRTLTLMPGEKAVVNGISSPVPQPFAVHQSVLTIEASANVWPLVLMDDDVRVAGFVSPGVEVNQVFGSSTGVGQDGTRTVEVPAGTPGPFVLIVEGKETGDFRVTMTGSFNGRPAYQRQLSGRIEKGQRWFTQISQTLVSATQSEPKTAQVQAGRVTELYRVTGPLPGKILLSPDELDAVGGNR